jgi:Fe-S-cluster containining protein
MDKRMQDKDKYIKLYTDAWKKLEDSTPLSSDCGELCGKKCCSGSDSDGMLLFPGEEYLYQNIDNSWFRVQNSDTVLPNGYQIKLLVCKGCCPRHKRPLSCRIFPFIPYINNKQWMELRYDLRGFRICPVVFNPMENPVNENFIENLYEAFAPLVNDENIVEFIEILSCQYDDIADFLSRFQKD